MSLIPTPTSKFMRVKCNECENEMIVFNHAKMIVKCQGKGCDEIIATPAGGKAEIHAEILEILN